MQIVFLHVRQFFLNFLQLCAESLKGKDFIVLENMNFCFSTTVPFSFQRIEQKKVPTELLEIINFARSVVRRPIRNRRMTFLFN